MKFIIFRLNYFLLMLALLFTETLIALFLKDQIIRPFIGDVLVVILLFSFFSAFLNFEHINIAIGVLIFAVGIETLQYIDIVTKFNFESNKIISIVLGRTFDWMDILAYGIGFGIVYFVACKRQLTIK